MYLSMSLSLTKWWLCYYSLVLIKESNLTLKSPWLTCIVTNLLWLLIYHPIKTCESKAKNLSTWASMQYQIANTHYIIDQGLNYRVFFVVEYHQWAHMLCQWFGKRTPVLSHIFYFHKYSIPFSAIVLTILFSVLRQRFGFSKIFITFLKLWSFAIIYTTLHLLFSARAWTNASFLIITRVWLP